MLNFTILQMVWLEKMLLFQLTAGNGLSTGANFGLAVAGDCVFVRYEKVGPFSSPLQALALSRVKYLDIPVVFTAMQNIGEVIHKKITIFI